MKKKQENDTTVIEVEKLQFQFRKTNKFIKRVVAHNRTLLFSLLVYLLFSAAIICFFMLIFRMFGCNCNFWQSCSVYLGMGKTSDIEKHRVIVMAEVICRDLFSIYVVGISISNILVPQNPLELSEFCVFKDNMIVIRYWVMLPIHEFLHDASIRVLVAEKSKIGVDSGRLVPKHKRKSYEYEENLKLIRGVRRVIVSESKSRKLMNKLKESDVKRVLWVIITGKLSNGKQYYVYKTYDLSTIHTDYTFVSTDTKNLSADIFCNKQIQKLKLPSMIYMHYNLAYCVRDNSIDLIYADNKRKQYVYHMKYKKEYKKEILNAEFKGINGRINYILNYFAVFYLNNPGKISAILRKII